MACLLAAAVGNYPLLPRDDTEHLPLPTVAVRRCSSTKLLAFANQDKQVREDVLIEILDAHFAPPAGKTPDLVFMPTSCGWADPALHQAQTFGYRKTLLAAGAARCTGSTPAPTMGLVNNTWCTSHCSASEGNCPESVCTCTASQMVEVTEEASTAPRLGYFALVASPWGAFPQARPLMQPLMEQQWPNKMVVLSTEIPAFATRWNGVSEEPEINQMVKWGEDHPPAAGLAVPYLTANSPANVPAVDDRPFLAAFIGSVYVNASMPSSERKTIGRSPLRELLVRECLDHANTGECGMATDITGNDDKESISRQEVYGTDLGMNRVTILAEEMYQKARFTFCPWGDTLSRKSTFDALMQGSIPVFFEGEMAKQYAQLGPIRNVSVQIPLDIVTKGGVLQFLRALPAERVRRLHSDVVRLRLLFHMPDSVDGYARGDAVDRIVRKVATHFRSFTAKSYADTSNVARSVPGSSPFGTLAELPLAPRLTKIKNLLDSGAISQEEANARKKAFLDMRAAAEAEAEAADEAYALSHPRQAEVKADAAVASTDSAERAAAAEVERAATAKTGGAEAEKAEVARAAAERAATAEAERAAAERAAVEDAERAAVERAAVAEGERAAAVEAEKARVERAEAEREAAAAAEKAAAAGSERSEADKSEAERVAATEAEKAAAAEVGSLAAPTEATTEGSAAPTSASTAPPITERGLPPVTSYESTEGVGRWGFGSQVPTSGHLAQ